MAREPIYLTAQGLEKKKEELKHLIEVRRPELAANMGKAIEDGDLRESAAYDEARMLQSENEAKIADLQEIIYRAEVVEAETGSNVPGKLGATLILEDPKGKKETFYLVGTHEADIFENRISDESPLGKELVGRRAGDEVTMRGPSGNTKFKVLEVKFE